MLFKVRFTVWIDDYADGVSGTAYFTYGKTGNFVQEVTQYIIDTFVPDCTDREVFIVEFEQVQP